MATTVAIGDAAFYQAKMGKVVDLPSLLTDEGRKPGVVFEYPLPPAEAKARPHVSLEIGDNGKPTGRKLEREWDDTLDGVRMARTTCFAADLQWDTGRKAWIVKGHGLKVEADAARGIDRELFIPDWSHPENLKTEKEG